jgi:hypothetical protein
VVVRRDHYWLHRRGIWESGGPISAALVPDIEAYEGRYPWDEGGVTALAWYEGNADLLLVSRDALWRFDLLAIGGTFVEAGHVSELVPPDPPRVAGLLPWEGEGVTGITRVSTLVSQRVVISGDRFYEHSAVTGTWIRAGNVSELWPGAPAVEGAHPWDPPGVTAFDRDGRDDTIVSGDRFWVMHTPTEVVASGRFAERYPDAPAIDAPCE